MENKKQTLRKLRNQRGLTLVELLAVIVILGIVSAIAFVMISNVIENSKKDAQIANAEQLLAAAKLYEATGEEIGSEGVTAEKLHEEGFIEDIVDPWDKDTIDMANSNVTKSEDEYSVTLTVSDGSDSDHNIEATESQLREGRKTVFGSEGTADGENEG